MDSEEDEDQVLVVEGQAVVVVDVEEGPTVLGLSILTLLHATGVGCMAIWPVTVPSPRVRRHREAAVLALPVENSLNPGIKAHSVDEAVDGKSGSVPSTSCTMRTGMSIPWTMQVSCTSHWTLDRLLPRRPQWKLTKLQKTEKVPGQCDCEMHHNVFNWQRTAKNKKKLEGSL